MLLDNNIEKVIDLVEMFDDLNDIGTISIFITKDMENKLNKVFEVLDL